MKFLVVVFLISTCLSLSDAGFSLVQSVKEGLSKIHNAQFAIPIPLSILQKMNDGIIDHPVLKAAAIPGEVQTKTYTVVSVIS